MCVVRAFNGVLDVGGERGWVGSVVFAVVVAASGLVAGSAVPLGADAVVPVGLRA